MYKARLPLVRCRSAEVHREYDEYESYKVLCPNLWDLVQRTDVLVPYNTILGVIKHTLDQLNENPGQAKENDRVKKEKL